MPSQELAGEDDKSTAENQTNQTQTCKWRMKNPTTLTSLIPLFNAAQVERQMKGRLATRT